MDEYDYIKALIAVKTEIYECSKDSLDEKGECICCMYPCWKMIAEEALEKQLEML